MLPSQGTRNRSSCRAPVAAALLMTRVARLVTWLRQWNETRPRTDLMLRDIGMPLEGRTDMLRHCLSGTIWRL
jgi:hypothetical protein